MARSLGIRFILLLSALFASSMIHANEAAAPMIILCESVDQRGGEPPQHDPDRPGVHHHGGCNGPASDLITRYSTSKNLYAIQGPVALLNARPLTPRSVAPGLRPPIA